MKRNILLNLLNQLKDSILNSDGVEEEDYDAENLIVDSDDGGDDEIIFDKELVDENLSRINLSIELQQQFIELYNVRRSVILQSHLSNKGLEGSPDDDEIDEDFLQNIDKNLPLSMDATIEEIDLLKYVLVGFATKRKKRVKEGKAEEPDHPMRVKFCKFLKSCWSISGAEKQEMELIKLEKKMDEKVRQSKIFKMEKLVADRIVQCIFLNYVSCTPARSSHIEKGNSDDIIK
jgi:hypothetical protein